ncbi:MAG: preprotein translocase subunit TatC [Phycisphaeraceae bacterium]|nr:preprotein translocase subunit TatC [Phycisphaeraceae bacterium]MCB9847760.1 preprotein translocase subunit TatC [Phycisphaeraceae bacterium]
MIQEDFQTMPFGEHLEELRTRLIHALLGLVPIFVVALILGGPLLEFLIRPAEEQLRLAGQASRLQATGPAEVFVAYIKVALVMSLLVGGPWIVYQAWKFVAPGLYRRERRFVYVLVPLSGALTAAGMVFLYYAMLPVMLGFLITFSSHVAQIESPTAPLPDGIVLPIAPSLRADPAVPPPGAFWFNDSLQELRFAIPDTEGAGTDHIVGVPLTGGAMIAQQYRVSEYINMVFGLGLAFSISFQLPLVMLLLGWSGLMEMRFLARQRKYALFICAIAGAVLTPADPASMILLAAPLYALYELGLLLMWLVPARQAVTDGAMGDE